MSSFCPRLTDSIHVLFLLCIVALPSLALSASEEDALEPFELSDALVSELLQPISVKRDPMRFALEGIEVVATDAGYNTIQFDITVDKRLNLWVGIPNDLRSGHMGEMRMEIDSLIDADGGNIHDPSLGNPWDANVTIYHRGDEVFSGNRTFRFSSSSEFDNLKRVSGRLVLRLPVDIEKFEFSGSSSSAFNALTRHAEIQSVEWADNHRLRLAHPSPEPGFAITIMGFDAQGERVPVEAEGYGGSQPDNHWFGFRQSPPYDRALVFLPGSMQEITVPFVMALQ